MAQDLRASPTTNHHSTSGSLPPAPKRSQERSDPRSRGRWRSRWWRDLLRACLHGRGGQLDLYRGWADAFRRWYAPRGVFSTTAAACLRGAEGDCGCGFLRAVFRWVDLGLVRGGVWWAVVGAELSGRWCLWAALSEGGVIDRFGWLWWLYLFFICQVKVHFLYCTVA